MVDVKRVVDLADVNKDWHKETAEKLYDSNVKDSERKVGIVDNLSKRFGGDKTKK